MREKRAVAEHHNVFPATLLEPCMQLLRIVDAAGGRDALGAHGRRRRGRRGLERRDDALGANEIRQLHNRSLSKGTTSTGRWAMPMPAALSASIFSAAVPAEPEMMAPACPMRRP